MNKVELIEALAPRLGGRQLAAMAVEALVDAVLREVAAGGSVGITGFGTFEKVDRAPRTGRNPHTGEPVPIAATSSPRFRPGAYFKEVVADPERLPTEGLAGVRVGSHGEMAEPEPTSRPSSVRRSGRQERPDDQQVGGTGAQLGGAGVGPGAPDPTDQQERTPGTRRRRVASGTPPTVRASRGRDTAATGAERGTGRGGAQDAPDGGPGETTPPPTGRGRSGGQDITMGMITAKKAQLARVKNDDVVAGGGTGTKGSGKGSGKGSDGGSGGKATESAKGKGKKGKKGAKGKKDKKDKKSKKGS